MKEVRDLAWSETEIVNTHQYIHTHTHTHTHTMSNDAAIAAATTEFQLGLMLCHLLLLPSPPPQLPSLPQPAILYYCKLLTRVVTASSRGHCWY